MLLCKKIKLEVSQEDAATLEFMQGKCRGLYNWWIGRLRDGEKWPGWKDAKASHLIAHKLVASTVVVGDLSQRQMVTKQHVERNKHLNRSVFNDWGCYTFVHMLLYKCQLYGREFHQISERDTSKMCHVCGMKQAMPLYKRTYRCENCGLVMDRDENSAHNILISFLARLGPHTGDPVRCADVLTAI